MSNIKKIFYLDDDLDDLDFFKEIAEEIGYDVENFTNGKMMLDKLETSNQKPLVIVLDVQMPVLNGEEILEIIKKNDKTKNIPIIMISGAYPKKLVKNYNELGVKYLVKRNNYKEFKEAIEDVLNDTIHNDEIPYYKSS